MTEPLTPEQIEALEQDLMNELLRLERSMGVSELATEVVELDQTAVGRLSRMDSLQNQSMAKNLKEREAVKLALRRDATPTSRHGDLRSPIAHRVARDIRDIDRQ